MSDKTKIITLEQKLASWLHRHFHRNDEGWAYEVERVVVGTETKTIRGVSTVTEIWSTYSDDDDNLHDWDGFSHQMYLDKAKDLMHFVEELKE